MAHKNIHRELFKCRIDVKVTAQNSPLASHAALLLLLPLPHTHPQPNTSSLCFCCVTQAAVTVWHVWMRLYQSQRSKVTVSSIKSVFLLFQRQRVRRGALDRIYIFTLKLSCPPDFSCYFSLEPGSRSHSLRVLEILVINCGFSKTNGSVRRYRFNICLPALVQGVCGCAATHTYCTHKPGPTRGRPASLHLSVDGIGAISPQQKLEGVKLVW